ncbi:Hypp7198 [Branchiostoma lanceolatum]|uniref:Hypp7198 protein n=1 Tax=Branchiostoma lanceolatum TaxID=7740 RepID=A0A8J9YYJ7_BRALA|nr:Hypp7198 [Branchiostoma lanceolatum]
MVCGGRLREEFRLQSFHRRHPDRNVFTRTPWMRNQLPFVLYRIVVCLYQIAVLSHDTYYYVVQPRSLAHLTDWGFIFLTASVLFT